MAKRNEEAEAQQERPKATLVPTMQELRRRALTKPLEEQSADELRDTTSALRVPGLSGRATKQEMIDAVRGAAAPATASEEATTPQEEE